MSDLSTDRSFKVIESVFDRRMVMVEGAITRHHAYLSNYLYNLTNQWQDAENLAQELWKYVLLRFEEGQIGQLSLLRRKAYQLFVDHYRKKVRRGETLAEAPAEQVNKPISQDAYTDEEELALKNKFWSEYPSVDLTEEQKEVLWLHARYGFTYSEIEEKTGIASSTVGDWIAKGRKALREALNSSS